MSALVNEGEILLHLATIEEPERNEGPKAKEMVQHRTLVVDDFIAAPRGDAMQNPTSSPQPTVVATPLSTQ